MFRISSFQIRNVSYSSQWNNSLKSFNREFHFTSKRGIDIKTKDPLNRNESLVDRRINKVGLGDIINRRTTREDREKVEQTGNRIKPSILPKKETFKVRNNVDEELLIMRREKALYKTNVDPYQPSTSPSVLSSEMQRKMAPIDTNLPQIRTRKVEVKTLSDGKTIEIAYGIGSRKASHATVTLTPGEGSVVVNERPLSQYFIRVTSRESVLEPLLLTHSLAKFDIDAKVWGGGLSGQAGAIQLAISRALQNWEPFNRPVLKQAKLLTRDPRQVERKKPGQKKARKKFQWVKR